MKCWARSGQKAFSTISNVSKHPAMIKQDCLEQRLHASGSTNKSQSNKSWEHREFRILTEKYSSGVTLPALITVSPNTQLPSNGGVGREHIFSLQIPTVQWNEPKFLNLGLKIPEDTVGFKILIRSNS